MNCNYKKAIMIKQADPVIETIVEQRTLWKLLTIAVLHDEFGFGKKRLERWGKAMDKLYEEFSDECRLTDTPHRRGSARVTNMDAATMRVCRNLRSYGIDYRKILGIKEIRIDGESIDAVLDRMEDMGNA